MRSTTDLARTWLVPLGALVVVTGLLLLGALVLDAGLAGTTDVFTLLLFPNAQSAADTLSSAGEIAAGVLAVAVTVVAIIVELAATRYTHRATDLFLEEPVNFVVMGLFVVAALVAIWVSSVFDPASGFVPRAGVFLSMLLLTLSLLLLLPYFAYVFAFLSPVALVGRMRQATLRSMLEGRRAATGRRQVLRGIDQLTDIGQNALDHHDREVVLASAEALHTLALRYLEDRRDFAPPWFAIDGALRHDADFASLDPDALQNLERDGTWFEWKLLRQCQSLFRRSLGTMPDLPGVLAIQLRRQAQAAYRGDHEAGAELVLRFFNSLLRDAIEGRDPAAASAVLHQYRTLAERCLTAGQHATSLAIARYLTLYGLVAFEAGLPAVLETVANDLEQLNELAFERRSPAARELLRAFLQVDENARSEVQETSLRGVRKAQVRLATYFLATGNTWAAKEVFRDMEGERPERLALIRDELLRVGSAVHWEVGVRGRNPDWLPPARRAHLGEFFGWFEGRLPAPPTAGRPTWLKTIALEPGEEPPPA